MAVFFYEWPLSFTAVFFFKWPFLFLYMAVFYNGHFFFTSCCLYFWTTLVYTGQPRFTPWTATSRPTHPHHVTLLADTNPLHPYFTPASYHPRYKCETVGPFFIL